jgi:hypothetical protein
MNINVKLDVHELVQRMDIAPVEIMKGLRSAVDRTARAARREAIKEAARDEGVSIREAGKNQPLVRGSTQSSLSASWTVKPIFVNIMRVSGARLNRGTGLEASTFRITGGGSAHLLAPKAFGMRVGNTSAPLAFHRFQFGPGTHRRGYRAMSAEMTRTAMGQEDGAARSVWHKVAKRELKVLAEAAVARALAGAQASNDHGID